MWMSVNAGGDGEAYTGIVDLELHDWSFRARTDSYLAISLSFIPSRGMMSLRAMGAKDPGLPRLAVVVYLDPLCFNSMVDLSA